MVLLEQKEALLQPQIVTLLSPIRDRDYLKSLVNPTYTAPDAGVGVIDNPFFFVAGHYPGGLLTPSAPEDRTYLVWFGSPAGTTNEKPQFSIFYAKVHPDQYKPGAPASQWLDPPVLLVSYDQIFRDVVNWADNVFTAAGYTPSSPGVINVPGTYVTNYGYTGYVGAPSTITLNFTGTPELKQLHMIYDMLDDTVLMYFSIIVPNWNPGTKAQYVYKFPVSLLKSQQSINQYAVSGLTPTTTSTPPPNDKPYFLGGLKFDDTIEQTIGTAVDLGAGNTLQMQSAPQFAISFDWYKLGGFMGYKPSNGFLPAIYVGNPLYMNGMFSTNYNYPHGDSLMAIAFADIHKNPAQPQTYYQPIDTSGSSYGWAAFGAGALPENLQTCPSSYNGVSYYCIPILGLVIMLDTFDLGLNIDKFGSIVPGESFGIHGVYTIPITLPPRPDWGGISSMRMKVLYVAPIFHQFEGYGGLSFAWTRDSVEIPYYPEMGTCRPYLTTLPDGKLKVTMGGYHADNYIDGVAIYLDKSVISPKGKTLVTVPSLIFGQTSAGGGYYIIGAYANIIRHGVITYTFGKKYARVYFNIAPGNAGFVNIYTRYRSRTAPDIKQMYGNLPNSGNSAVYYPVIERNFGTLVHASDYSYNMPTNFSYPKTSKFRVDDQVLWIFSSAGVGSMGIGPVWVELEGD